MELTQYNYKFASKKRAQLEKEIIDLQKKLYGLENVGLADLDECMMILNGEEYRISGQDYESIKKILDK